MELMRGSKLSAILLQIDIKYLNFDFLSLYLTDQRESGAASKVFSPEMWKYSIHSTSYHCIQL